MVNSFPDTGAVVHPEAITGKVGRYRWRICLLLFFATTLNYMDRQVLGLLAPVLQTKIGWNDIQYGYIVTAFQGAYAIGLLFMGRLIDRLGTRIGYTIAISVWSLAAMGHALANSALGFGLARFALRTGRIRKLSRRDQDRRRMVSEERKSAQHRHLQCRIELGAIIAPLAVPWVTLRYGWRWAFVFTGIFSAIWIVVWWTTYRTPVVHKKLSARELAHICSDPQESVTKIPWLKLLPHRQTWAFVLGKFLTDPVWWFYLYWFPKFLNEKHGLTLNKLGPPLVLIYVMADVGSIGGGWLSGAFLRRGWSENRARKMAMLICALGAVPMLFASGVAGMWQAVGLLGLASAAHQGWSANIFTLVSDMFPQRAVASVVGIGGFGGAVGGMLIATFTGFLLQTTHSYRGVFLIAGLAYLTALLVIHFLAPRLEPARIQ